MKIEFIYSKRADKFFDKHTNLKEEFEKNLISYFKGNRNVDIIIIYTVDAGNRGKIYNNIKNIKKNLKF